MKKDDSKSTILVILTGFLIVYLYFSYKWAIYVSVILGIIGIFVPYLAEKIELIWMKISDILGYIVPNILLSFVFFFLLTPISFFFRLFNKDILMLINKYDSYFLDVDKELNKKDFEKIW